MIATFNVTGAERKRLVNAISEFTGEAPKYLGAPTFAYQVDYFTIDKAGSVSFNDNADPDQVNTLLAKLEELGFHCESCEYDEPQPGIEIDEATEDCPPPYDTPETLDAITISVPLDQLNLGNLTALLDAKGSLIRKALDIPATPIEPDEEKVSFPWFSTPPCAADLEAYVHFICALCKMSREQKRITAKEKEVDNDKYAFRCFLLRLGFIGAEFKEDRKILLRNLTGSSAFKSGAKKEATSDVSE